MLRVAAIMLIFLMLMSSIGASSSGAEADSAPSGRIAYVGADNRLHVLNIANGQDAVIPTLGTPSYPRWSPRTGEIVFAELISVEPRIQQVSLVDPLSGRSRVLVPPEVIPIDPDRYFAYHHVRWSPDGSAVYYRKNGGNRTLQFLTRVDASGRSPQESSYSCTTCAFDISPTDGRIAMAENGLDDEAGSSRLWISALDGSGGSFLLPYGSYFYDEPMWTADGKSIALMRRRGGDERTELNLIDVASGRSKFLLAGGGKFFNSTYTFSIDASWFVMSDGNSGRLTLYKTSDRNNWRDIGAGRMPAWEAGRYFNETGFSVRGRFLQYWLQNGGLTLNGYPLTGEIDERLEDGNVYTVQYFERTRLELHPTNVPPNDVLLGQFGRRIRPADPPASPISGLTYFSETGHNLGGAFRLYWELNGGLRQFGYPITEEITERLEDGKEYRVQYFERARFEYHPENQPPYDVLLGQFGRRILNTR